MRTIKANHTAVAEPIADLVTFRAMPTTAVAMNRLDPFIFLNHHGWQQYKPNNTGLPFGPHPHRGFETVTFILEGDLMHKDSSGASSTIKAGGIQWMTAGSGLIHAEISSDEFKKEGGPLEILQLWVNLPAKYKMTAPKYVGLQKEDIPTLTWDSELITAQIISGVWDDKKGPVEPLTDIHLSKIEFKAGGAHTFNVEADKTIFLYIVKGEMKINGEPASIHHLVEFNNDGKIVEMKAITDAIILFGYATPFKEPFVAYGPFVMNTQEEIMQAYEDYNNGKFGTEEL
jgi:redox-sensitive bicupin YhaK (pirin superfamily)